MGENTKIAWCDHTFNPWIGCVKVAAGCKNCYAEGLAQRWGWDCWGKDAQRIRTSTGNWNSVMAWNRKAAKAGVRRTVFCGSLMDIAEAREDLNRIREDVWELVLRTPNLYWLFLTKRPENFPVIFPKQWVEDGAPDNVAVGTSVCDRTDGHRIDALLEVKARVRFLSCEPLLDEVVPVLRMLRQKTMHWVIVGGESGPNARPMHPAWVRSIRNWCMQHGVPFFFKQWGEYVDRANCPEDVFPNGHPRREVAENVSGGAPVYMYKVGTKQSGHSLDGEEYRAIPELLT